MRINVMDHGAVADGVTVCTEAIQRAIDLCKKGDEAYIPRGCFITGALFLKSNTTLFLEEGALLKGSEKLEDYPIMGYPFEGMEQLCYASLLNTDGAPHENITIEGEGVIDAAGAALFAREMEERKGKRGRAVCIRNAVNVTIRGVTIRQSPSWCLHLIYCQNVLLEHIQVHTKYDENGNRYEGIFNGDGIDVDSCKDVVIRNSLIASQDDCIAVKSGRDQEGRRAGVPSKRVLIENCTFKSGFGVAIGSEMSGGVRDVNVKNCTFENTFSIASIKAVRGRGGYIRDIRFDNCSLINRDRELHDTRWFRGAIYMDGFYGCEEFDPDTPVPVDEGTPTVEGIIFKNITLDTVGGNAVYLCGLPESPFRDVYMENVKARGVYGMTVKNIEDLQQINVEVSGEEEGKEL